VIQFTPDAICAAIVGTAGDWEGQSGENKGLAGSASLLGPEAPRSGQFDGLQAAIKAGCCEGCVVTSGAQMNMPA